MFTNKINNFIHIYVYMTNSAKYSDANKPIIPPTNTTRNQITVDNSNKFHLLKVNTIFTLWYNILAYTDTQHSDTASE